MQNAPVGEVSREISFQQPIVECRGDTGLWWLFYKPQIEQTRELTINNNEVVSTVSTRDFQNAAVDLNQRLAVR